MTLSYARSIYNKIHMHQPFRHYFLTYGEKKYLYFHFCITFFWWENILFFSMIESSRFSNDQIHNYLNKTQIFYQTHGMNNENRERKNMTLQYESLRTTFSNQILQKAFSCKLEYQLWMAHGKKTIVLIMH